MADLENIAQRIRDSITSDDESVWLDLAQVIGLVRPALSAFFDAKLQDTRIRAMFPTEKITITVTAGEVDLSNLNKSYLAGIINETEIFLGSWKYPVRVLSGKEQLVFDSILDCLYLKAFKEGSKLVFAKDSTGQFGGATINAVGGYIVAPKVSLDVGNLPELVEGEFVAFAADFMKDQIFKRA